MARRLLLACVLLPYVSAWFFGSSTQGDCDVAPEIPEDRRHNKSRLVVASFNAEWLFDGETGPSSCPWKDATIATEHLNNVSTAINSMDPMPDVLFLQEVQNCNMLQRLAKGLKGAEYKWYLVPGTDTATQQNTGLLTRVDPVSDPTRTDDRHEWPIDGNQCDYTFKKKTGSYGVSKHMFVTMKVGNDMWTFINLHFLAYPTKSDRCVKREAQASVLRQHVDKTLAEGHNLVIVGDYNDYSDKVKDVADDTPTSRTLRILRDGLIGADNSTTTLYEVSHHLPQSERYSCVYNGDSKSQIDHILISKDVEAVLTAAHIDHGPAFDHVSDHWPFVFVAQT